MKRTVSVTPRADEDLDELANYIANDNLQAALRFLEAARRTFRRLGETPGIGSPCVFQNSRLTGIRRWPIKSFENHLIFYRIIKNNVEMFVCCTELAILKRF